MRIFKVSSEETPSFESNAYKTMRKIIGEERLEWKLSSSGLANAADPSSYFFVYAGFIKQTKTHPIGAKIHNVLLHVTISPSPPAQLILKFEVLLNQKMSLSSADHIKIKSMSLSASANDLKTRLADILSSEFGITDPPPIPGKEETAEEYSPRTRLTRTNTRYNQAAELIINVEPRRFKNTYAIYFVVNNLETGEQGEPMKVSDTATRGEIAGIVRELINTRCKANGYVDESSIEYIPEGANPSNFDFVLNNWKKNDAPSDTPTGTQPATKSLKNLFASGFTPDYEGYFSGDIPDSAASMIGTPSVDASQIKSMFGKADEAIKLVNQFDSSLLSPVSFIFNFGKSGAYGVYLSTLDRAIKTKALQKQLESRGYKIDVNERGLLTAYPTKEEKPSEEIQRDIDTLYKEIESKGSTAFGINMNAILNSSKADASAMNSTDPNVWEWIAILHLGSTITHEAIHAKGAMDEGPAEAGAGQFLNFALPIVNHEYEQSLKAQKKEDVFRPLMISTTTRHASKSSWYRKAQSYMPMPQSVMDMPYGSDLSGRFPTGVQTDAGMAMWNLISQQNSTAPIETKLGRQYMFPIYPDINPNKDSIEEQLRKSTKNYKKLDPKASMEELLSEGHDANRGYQTMEQLLDENRVKPLMVTLKKSASLIRTATLFGWMNNLQISDGSTIPGMGDRVMAWEDRDEDFAEEESWIRKQPRYNPSYDIKGFYYRWIEPRFKPQLFDDMTRDYSGTSPAKRFAHNDDGDNDIGKMLSVFTAAKQKIMSGEISGTRFIMTEDVLHMVEKVFGSCECHISIFYYTQADTKEDIYSVWVYSNKVSEEDIEKIERHFQKKDDGQEQDVLGLVEKITGIDSQKQKVIDSILGHVDEICRDYEIGASFDKNLHVLDNGTIVLNFKNIGKDAFLKIGSLLAESLGFKDPYMESDRVTFVYKGYQVSMVNKNKEMGNELV